MTETRLFSAIRDDINSIFTFMQRVMGFTPDCNQSIVSATLTESGKLPLSVCFDPPYRVRGGVTYGLRDVGGTTQIWEVAEKLGGQENEIQWVREAPREKVS